MDADTGEVLLEQNGDARLPMASTTKIMTALVALGEGNLDQGIHGEKGIYPSRRLVYVPRKGKS